jgi:two-component sensor histidine kinase
MVEERGPKLTECQRYVVSCLASELVTNAVKHASPCERGRRAFSIQLRVRADTIRVEVLDPDPSPPEPRAPDFASESGRGLVLVAAQAKEWGTCPLPCGKSVWFSVATHATV